MSVEVYFLDQFATREAAIKYMMDLIGRDVDDLTFTPSGGTDGADLPDDPDVLKAWRALSNVYTSVCSAFLPFNSREEVEIAVDGSGNYVVPALADGTAADELLATAPSGVSAVQVWEQPDDLDLILRDDTLTTTPRLWDRVSGDFGDFTGKSNIKCRVAYFVEWTYLPLPVRQHIVTRAAQSFADRAVASGAIDLRADIRDATVAFQSYLIESQQPNIYTDGMADDPGITERYPY